MNNIKGRLSALKQHIDSKMADGGAAVAFPVEGGGWCAKYGRSNKEHIFDTLDELSADFNRVCGADSVLIVWDIGR